MARREHDCAWRTLAEERANGLEYAELEIKTLKNQLETSEAKLATALAQIAEYERRLFGRSTERIPPVERELRRTEAETETTDSPDTESQHDDGGNTAKPKRKKRARPEEAPGLRNETIEHPVSERARKCPHCGGMAEPIGTGKFTTEWEYVPGYFVRRRHIQEVVACRCGDYVARAEAPLRVIDRTQFGPGLLAYLIVSKCADATPIYRVEKQFERLGIPIARSTLNDLVHRGGELLEPLYDALVAEVIPDPHLQADETSVRLHNRPDKRGFIWTFLSAGGKCVVYVFSGDRSGQTPSRILAGTRGSLVVDGYTGYNDVTNVDGRDRAGCWSHARRYFFNALDVAPEARDVLDMILELFRVERQAIEKGIFGTAEHHQLRLARSQPTLDRIKTWIAEQRPQHLPESPMGAALRYATNQWEPLTLFMTDPKIPIHNNASEAALRIIALGRKNSLFFGNEDAARRFSVLYSLVATAERNDINPLAYLEDVLMRVQTHPQSKIAELLPHRWKPPPQPPPRRAA
jgi:transposase